MNKSKKDRVSSLFWIVVATGICAGSLKLSLGTFRNPGPGFFPFWGGAILGVLSILHYFQSLKDLPGDVATPLWRDRKRLLKAAYVMIALVLYAIGMNYAGFALSTLLFLGFLLRGIDPQRWPVVLSVSIFGSLISYIVFQYCLEVELPRGILGF